MKKTVSVYFFFLLLFLLFFYSLNSEFGLLSNFKKKIEVSSCAELNYEEAQIIHPSNFKKFNIDLKIKERRKWIRINLEDAIKSREVGSFTNRRRVLGTMTFKINSKIKCNLNVSFRAHGDQVDHRQGKGLPSLNVKALDGHIFGITDFILLKPEVRKYDNEIFATALLQEMNFLAPRTASVKLKYNFGTQKYIFQEKIVKEFLENSGKREGPIYEGDERFIFFESDIGEIKFINNKLSNENWAKKNINNRLISELGFSILNKHGVLHKMDIPKNYVVDYFTVSQQLGSSNYFKKLPAFDAIMFSLDAIGNLSSQDRRFYYNTIAKEFEPIFYDGKPTLLNKANNLTEPKLSSIENLFITEKPYGTYFYPNLLWGKVIPSAVVGADTAIDLLKKVDPDNLQKLINERGLPLNKSQVNKAINIINKKLTWLKNFDEKRIYKVSAETNSPVEASDQTYKSDIKRRLVYYGEKEDEFLSCNIYGKNCEEIQLNDNEKIRAIGQNLTDDKDNKLIFVGKEKTNIANDGWKYYLNKKNYQALPRNNIKLPQHVILQKIGNIKVDIEKENKKIFIEKNDKNGKIIFTGGELKDWKIEFTDFSKKEDDIINDINGLTGCINFYKIKVTNLQIKSKGSKCEDAVNIINSNGLIKKVEIHDSYSDGLDVDFSNISFENVVIKNSYNDCIDLSFGNYLIQNLETNKCGDKALSVGETSIVKLKSFTSINSDIGLASKDFSKVFSKNIKLDTVQTCISVYKKKKEFSGGLVVVENLDCSNYINKLEKDNFSKVIFSDYEF